jgi:hypothetical protein
MGPPEHDRVDPRLDLRTASSKCTFVPGEERRIGPADVRIRCDTRRSRRHGPARRTYVLSGSPIRCRRRRCGWFRRAREWIRRRRFWRYRLGLPWPRPWFFRGCRAIDTRRTDPHQHLSSPNHANSSTAAIESRHHEAQTRLLRNDFMFLAPQRVCCVAWFTDGSPSGPFFSRLRSYVSSSGSGRRSWGSGMGRGPRGSRVPMSLPVAGGIP